MLLNEIFSQMKVLGGKKMRRRVLIEISLACLVLGMAPTSSVGEDYPNPLHVPYYNQGDTNWCTISALAMVMRYYGEDVHPWDVANALNIKDPKDAIRVFDLGLGEKVKNYVVGKGYSFEKYYILSEKDIRKNIDNGKPVIVNYYIFEKNYKGGHSIVIVGYTQNRERFKYYIHDSYEQPEEGMLRLIDPNKVGWWSEYQPGGFLVISKSYPSPPDAVISRCFYSSDGGNIRSMYYGRSTDSISFSEHISILSDISRNSQSSQLKKMKIRVVLVSLSTRERYQKDSEEFSLHQGKLILNRPVTLYASEIGSGKYEIHVLLIDSENGYQYDEIGQINCTVFSESRIISSYNVFKGEGEIYVSRGNGDMELLKQFNNWRHTWSIIVAGNFGGDSLTDLLFYDPVKGEGEIYVSRGNGDMELLKQFNNWRHTWSIIVPGNFGGDSLTDLLFYDPRKR
ncbi:MAG: C39 family peptidase [Theionarchaea archaeon]|nr:C39 family peptidase [Theionarchaea archaeon]